MSILAIIGSAMLIATADQRGYLATTPDITLVVPPPPQRGDPRYEADRRVFRVTRAALSSPRGSLATRDIPDAVPDLMRVFSCAAGVLLSPDNSPATYRLLANADADTARANNAAKDRWKRPRPFLVDSGPVCQDKKLLERSYDYPSGHTTRAWTAGLILSDLEPDRANLILIRARAFGESRIICGAHTMSAIEAGSLGATVSMQYVRQAPRYRADFAEAKAELAALRERPGLVPDSAVCSAEQSLTAQSVLASLRR
jgi:acid phosphatase (class A)